MNITKTNKSKPEIIHQSKSFLLISSDYKLETLYRILTKNPSLVNTKDQKNETFLSYAIKRKNSEICELILTSPILDVSYLDKKGNSYLHLSVIYQLENIIRLLIKKGININLQNNEGNTALHYAYNTGDIKFIAILIENSADLNIKNNNGLIPEEIEIDSLMDDINSINDLEISNSNYNTSNSATIKINDKNVNNLYFKDMMLNSEKSKINKTIKIDLENSDINNKGSNNNTKTNFKYSLVNFSYSEDEENNKDDDENENTNVIKDKKSVNDNDTNKSKNENIKNSDIFELTSSITYQEKLAHAESINSHVIGNLNIYKNNEIDENNDDIVNLEKIKSPVNNSLVNNSGNKIIYKTGSYKNKNFCDENNDFDGIKSFNIENKKNIIMDYNISKDRKQNNNTKNKDNFIYQNNGKKIDLIENKNTIFDQPEFNENFSFSPFGTLKEPLCKQNQHNDINKNIKLENQQLFYNTVKNVKINNNLKNNNISYISSSNNNKESLTHQNPSFLNSKSNMDFFSSEMTAEDTVNKSKNPINNSQISLYNFLLEIKLDKYYNLLNSNGFEDIQVLINQGKSILAITDAQLKEVGIDIPGDRAKILIRLQEKAGNFQYQIPKNVYYTCNDLENYINDLNIKKLYEWLQTLKIEKYLENFVEGGYHSVELMLIQMESKNPITDVILKDELGINKIGHRARIINKLLEEGKKYNNKLKSSMLIVGKNETEKICDCMVF